MTIKNTSVIKIEVTEDCKCYFGLFQKDERLFRKNNNLGVYTYSYFRIMISEVTNLEFDRVGRIPKENLSWVWGEFDCERVIWSPEMKLKRGVYLVAIESEWSSSCRDFTFGRKYIFFL